VGIKQRLFRSVVRQFHDPTGPGGHVAGWIMGRRSSNVQRSRWAVDLLHIQPTDRVIELGCGPGVAIAALASTATRGQVVGVDHSEVMIGQARRRNAAAIRAGRVRLIHAPVERLPQVTDGLFDAALAVNTVGFWPEPAARLRDIGRLLRPGGRIALVSQPRCPGASEASSAKAAKELAALLLDAGFEDLRCETLNLDPPAACILGTVALAPSARRHGGVGSVSMTPDERWLAAVWPFVHGSLPAAPARVVEIGCGPLGGFVPRLEQAGYEATGVDPEAPSGASYQQAEFEDWDNRGHADAIVACTSLHHVAGLAEVLNLVDSALIPGGTVVVVEWAREWFDEATARWCFGRLPGPGADPGWLDRLHAEWRESGQPWDAYLEDWARAEGMHTGLDILNGLDARFDREALSFGPYFFADLAGTSEADEQASIDIGLIKANRIDYVGRRTDRG
jgi:SAM-dependent methyltransferase